MTISSAPTVVFREDDADRNVTAAIAYSFSGVAQDNFTYPISLAGAKSVWVQNTSASQSAAYYIPSYDGGALNVTTDPIGLMTTTATGTGLAVTAPSSSGAGFISGNCIPPALSVKHTGATVSVIIIHITY